jgi:hypothetical protein
LPAATSRTAAPAGTRPAQVAIQGEIVMACDLRRPSGSAGCRTGSGRRPAP